MGYGKNYLQFCISVSLTLQKAQAQTWNDHNRNWFAYSKNA